MRCRQINWEGLNGHVPAEESQREFGSLVRALCAQSTPSDIIGKFNAAAMEALSDPTVRSRLVDLGYEIFPREKQTPEVLGALVKSGAEEWWPIIKELGIKG